MESSEDFKFPETIYINALLSTHTYTCITDIIDGTTVAVYSLVRVCRAQTKTVKQLVEGTTVHDEKEIK